ncbi:cytochrome P450 [Dichomitus squalens]|uniref:Cytochrome P450 n=1 Tax=Dichomitus squalens TaxID=114155 RepID=A0A4Q9MPF6_9APHY|nr:cytochrome P450 [Dichomitus squalens]
MLWRNVINRLIDSTLQISGCGSLTVLDVALAVVFLVLLFMLIRRGSSPPGPFGVPFIGVAWQIPSDKQWLKFHDWISHYGDIVAITVMGTPTLIVGSFKAANDLLDAKGTIYSDRPNAVMAGELVGWDRGLGYAHAPDNPRFRGFRRLFQHFIGPRACLDSHILGMQEEETHRLMMRFLRDPTNFYRHPRESTGALILRLAYGYEVARDAEEDPLVRVVEVAMQGFAKASEPGAFLVDSFPLLRYVPEWILPRGGFKAVARRMRRELDEMYDLPFRFVKTQMEAGKAIPSFTTSYLEEKITPTPADEELIKAAAASLYSGGADTTPSSMTAFILAMTLWPDVQTRAQAELDSVLGASWTRLPTFADRPKLPYVNAIVLEVLRWNPAVPLGLAHRLTQDDVYRGWFIQKGTVVWANIWSMLQDPTVFPEPQVFRPERYLREDGTLRELERYEDPSIIGFGFGRRICPGMFFAMNSVFIGIATMLYVFHISKSKDENGNDIIPAVEFRGFISHPVPFRCDITARSEEAAVLIRKMVGEN